jgi:hypothetical protein
MGTPPHQQSGVTTVWSIFRKLFGTPPAEPVNYGERDANPVVTASIMGTADKGGPVMSASAGEGEEAKPDYQAFADTFHVWPGVKMMDFLDAEKVTRLKAWLHWSTPEAEPKAFIRLMLELMRRGVDLRDQPGLSLYVDGRWSQGGGPSQESQDALSVLAQVLQKPIKVFFRKKPSEPILVMEFNP